MKYYAMYIIIFARLCKKKIKGKIVYIVFIGHVKWSYWIENCVVHVCLTRHK